MACTIHTRFDRLPASYQRLFDAAGADSFHATAAWFRVLAETALAADEQLRLIAVDGPDGPAALLPAIARGRRLAGLANFYSCTFTPLLGADATAGADALAAGLAAMAWDRLDLPAMPAADPAFSLLAHRLRRGGLAVQPYFQFGNWYEDTAGLSFDAYSAARPGILRSTLRRHNARLARRGGARFDVVTGADGLETALAAYEAVYARSWKEAEPFPRFTTALARAAAAIGALRLGVAHVDGMPAAAQLWLVWRGRATIFKLAHDEAHASLSIGSLLTMRLMRHVLDVDGVVEVDFGRGDDPYKRLWLSKRRERWGLAVFNPRSLGGAVGALRHIGGHRLKRLLAPTSAPSPR